MAFGKKMQRSLPFLLMVLPGFFWVFILNYLPMGGVILAFKRLRFHGGFIRSVLSSEWVGFENFRFLFGSGDSWTIVRNTLAYNITFIIFGTVCAITLAIAFSRLRSVGVRSVYQTMVLFPHFISWVVVSYFSIAFLHPTNGLLNSLLEAMGADSVNWYSILPPWPFILITTNIWKGIGFGAALYLAAILNIDQSLYEAARIDGSNTWQEIRYITLPFLKRLIIVLILLAIGGIFRADFGLFYQIPRNVGVLYPVTDVIDTYVFRSLIVLGDIPMGTAAGLFQSLVGFVLILFTNSIVKRFDADSSLF